MGEFIVPLVDLDFVYADTRYCKEHSPHCIYIPSKKLMLKIMRACIGIKNAKDLWFQYEGKRCL